MAICGGETSGYCRTGNELIDIRPHQRLMMMAIAEQIRTPDKEPTPYPAPRVGFCRPRRLPASPRRDRHLAGAFDDQAIAVVQPLSRSASCCTTRYQRWCDCATLFTLRLPPARGGFPFGVAGDALLCGARMAWDRRRYHRGMDVHAGQRSCSGLGTPRASMEAEPVASSTATSVNSACRRGHKACRPRSDGDRRDRTALQSGLLTRQFSNWALDWVRST